MSVSAISQPSLFATTAVPTRTRADPKPSDASSSSAATQNSSSSSTPPAGSAALFKQLTSDLQAFLVQVQAGASTPATAASGTATNASLTTGDTSSSASADAASDVDPTSGATQAVHHHHHHGGGQEAGSASQLQADASSLLSDLAGKTGSGSSAASSTSTASADPTSANASSSGISASFFGAFRAYASTNTQPQQPNQLGFA